MENNQKVITTSSVIHSKVLYKKMYDRIFLKERIINIIIIFYMIFMLVALFSMGKGNFLSFIFVLLMISLFIFLFKKKDNKTKKIINESNYSNVMSKMIFYDDYFEILYSNDIQTKTQKRKYHEITKILDDEKYLYILFNDVVDIVDKKDVNLDLLNKLNKKIYISEEEYKTNNKLNFVFLFTLFSVFLALLLIMLYIIIFNVPGFPLAIMENLWMLLLFIPVPIYSVFLGCKYIKNGYKCFKNIFVGTLVIILFFVCSTISFVNQERISHSFYYLNNIEEKLPIDFPSKGKISVGLINDDTVRKVIMVKFKDKESMKEIVQDSYWVEYQSVREDLFDSKYLNLTKDYDYFLNYNLTQKRFNAFRENDIILYIAYNETNNTMFILEYKCKSLFVNNDR